MSILKQWTQKQSAAIKDISGKVREGILPGSSTTDPTLTNANRNYLVMIKQNMDIATVPGVGKTPMIVVGQVSQDFQIDQEVKWATPWGAGLAGDGLVGDILAVATGNRLVAQVATLQVWQGAGNDITFTLNFELRAWSDTSRDVMIPLQYLLAMSMPSLDSDGSLRSPGPILDSEALTYVGQAIPKVVKGIGSASLELGGNIIKSGVSAVKNAFSGATGSTTDGAAEAINVQQLSDSANKLKSEVGAVAKKAELNRLMKNKISISIGQWFELDNVVITNVNHTLKPQMPGPKGGLMAADVTVSFRPMFALTTDDIPTILKVSRTGVLSAVNDPLKIG